MLLLEHMVAQGRGRGFRAFTATLNENAAMLRVFADAGLQAQRSLADGVYDLTFPLPAGEADAALGTYLDTVAARERAADVASMQPVLMPASVAVIGASRRAGSVGRVILRNIISAGFSGPVYPVNPYASELDGIACVRLWPRCPTRSTWRSLRYRRGPCSGSPTTAGAVGSRPWW